MLPPVLKPVSSRMRNMRPFFPFSLAVQELEGVFSLREEDIESLRTLKRLVQMLAGIDPTIRGDGDNTIGEARISRVSNKEGVMSKDGLTTINPSGGRSASSSGLIDAEDLALVQQVLTQFSSRVNVKPGQWPRQALKVVASTASSPRNSFTNTADFRSQMRAILPLIRDSVPGATKLAIRFGRRLVVMNSLTLVGIHTSPIDDCIVNIYLLSYQFFFISIYLFINPQVSSIYLFNNILHSL